jgi:predicted enzyme related to lactoylglutathione lyase/quinol monooxygenase YgiN
MERIETAPVSLTSTWFIRPGCESAALDALGRLAAQVHEHEPGTLMYRVHTALPDSARLQSLPPLDRLTVVFMETYRDADSFRAHVDGPLFTGFVREHGALFVGTAGQPFTSVSFLALHCGFERDVPAVQAGAQSGNRHACAMFEVIARDQAALLPFYTRVFGWRYERGVEGFAYVHFNERGAAALGGIGQADPAIPGYRPGINFYLQVDDIDATIVAAEAAGGRCTMPPAGIDGYRFALIADPEGNPIGLIKAAQPTARVQ